MVLQCTIVSFLVFGSLNCENLFYETSKPPNNYFSKLKVKNYTTRLEDSRKYFY